MYRLLTRFSEDERGVNGALGYVLLLAVVFISISSVVMFAGPVIQDQQGSEYDSNTVRAFEVFSKNLQSIERERSPSRTTEMRFQEGELFVDSEFFMRVNVTHDGVKTPYVLAGTPVSYQKDTSGVHYEMGAVIRQDENEFTMRSEPPFSFSDDRTRMSVVTTTVLSDRMSLARSDKVVIRSREAGTGTRAFIQGDDPSDIEVDITLVTPRYKMWKEYFESEGVTIDNVDAANNEIRVSFTTQEFMLRNTLIRIEGRN